MCIHTCVNACTHCCMNTRMRVYTHPLLQQIQAQRKQRPQAPFFSLASTPGPAPWGLLQPRAAPSSRRRLQGRARLWYIWWRNAVYRCKVRSSELEGANILAQQGSRDCKQVTMTGTREFDTCPMQRARAGRESPVPRQACREAAAASRRPARQQALLLAMQQPSRSSTEQALN